MTPDRLREIGQELHGSQWQTALAKQIGITARSMRNYAAGGKIPRPTAMAIEGELVKKRIIALAMGTADG